jgi:hypothetical protein
VKFIIMTKIEQAAKNGNMIADKWNCSIKIYNTVTGKQMLSSLKGNELTSSELETHIQTHLQVLIADIKNIH